MGTSITQKREEKNFVGYQNVPVPVNIKDSKTLFAMYDNNGSNDPWNTNVVKRLSKGSKKEWFSSCIADSENHLVWAASTRTGTIHAFSTLENTDTSKLSAAILCFEPLEAKAASHFVNGSFGLAKCGGTIIGSGATGRLSAWDINSALEDSSKTIEPHIMRVDETKNFLCGDVQCVGNSKVIVAPLRFDFNESNHSSTKRIWRRMHCLRHQTVNHVLTGMGEACSSDTECGPGNKCIIELGASSDDDNEFYFYDDDSTPDPTGYCGVG